jgi:hypothetical protein
LSAFSAKVDGLAEGTDEWEVIDEPVPKKAGDHFVGTWCR